MTRTCQQLECGRTWACSNGTGPHTVLPHACEAATRGLAHAASLKLSLSWLTPVPKLWPVSMTSQWANVPLQAS